MEDWLLQRNGVVRRRYVGTIPDGCVDHALLSSANDMISDNNDRRDGEQEGQGSCREKTSARSSMISPKSITDQQTHTLCEDCQHRIQVNTEKDDLQ